MKKAEQKQGHTLEGDVVKRKGEAGAKLQKGPGVFLNLGHLNHLRREVLQPRDARDGQP